MHPPMAAKKPVNRYNDDEEDDLLAKALYYQPGSESSEEEIEDDLTRPATTAEQYIRRVIKEARGLQDVVVAEIDSKKLKKADYNYVSREKAAVNSTDILPTTEWQDSQIRDFSELRLKLSRHLSLIRKESSTETLPNWPSKNNDKGEKAWAIFCFGSKFWNDLVALDEDRGEPVKTEEEVIGTPPLLSVISRIRQPIAQQLLEFMVDWITELKEFDSDKGAWIYCLLAILEKPLLPDAISCLRSLALICSEYRKKSDVFVPHLNLFICLVSKYFGQSDLED